MSDADEYGDEYQHFTEWLPLAATRTTKNSRLEAAWVQYDHFHMYLRVCSFTKRFVIANVVTTLKPGSKNFFKVLDKLVEVAHSYNLETEIENVINSRLLDSLVASGHWENRLVLGMPCLFYTASK